MPTAATTTRTIVIAGGREHHVLEEPETILAMFDLDRDETGGMWLRLTNVHGDLVWVSRSLVSAFIEGGIA
jgi:hypothetical protein